VRTNFETASKLLLSFGVPRDEVDKLNAGWKFFIELDQKQKLLKQVWPKSTDFDFTSQLRQKLKSHQSGMYAALGTEAGREIAKTTWTNFTSLRGVVVAQLRSERKAYSDPAVHKDLASIESWYGLAFNRIAAIQHGCDIVEITDVPGSAAMTKGQRLFDKISSLRNPATNPVCFGYPREFIAALGNIDPKEFDEALAKQRVNLEPWYEKADSSGLRRALDALVELLEKKYGFSETLIPEIFAPPLTVMSTSAGAALGALVTYSISRRGLLGAVTGAAAGAIIGKPVELATEGLIKQKTVARHIVERASRLRPRFVS
jgi:hypothetical protein